MVCDDRKFCSFDFYLKISGRYANWRVNFEWRPFVNGGTVEGWQVYSHTEWRDYLFHGHWGTFRHHAPGYYHRYGFTHHLRPWDSFGVEFRATLYYGGTVAYGRGGSTYTWNEI
jgi:hypothetical protein